MYINVCSKYLFLADPPASEFVKDFRDLTNVSDVG
jgi:hypothetical protein